MAIAIVAAVAASIGIAAYGTSHAEPYNAVGTSIGHNPDNTECCITCRDNRENDNFHCGGLCLLCFVGVWLPPNITLAVISPASTSSRTVISRSGATISPETGPPKSFELI